MAKQGDSFVASQVDGIDFIASGHTHTFMEKPGRRRNGDGCAAGRVRVGGGAAHGQPDLGELVHQRGG